MAQLPEFEVKCRNGHAFTTRAKAGSCLSCPVCRPIRVSVWVSRKRPRTERAARELAARAEMAEGSAEGSALADRWDREAPWDGQPVMLPGRPGDECPECSGPLLWESGRTVVCCLPCETAGLPDAVAEVYRRRERQSAEVARVAPAGDADRDAREVYALREVLAEQLAALIGDDRLSAESRGILRWYDSEVRKAQTTARLGDLIERFKGEDFRPRRWWQGAPAPALGITSGDYDDYDDYDDYGPDDDDGQGRVIPFRPYGQPGETLATPESIAEHQWRAQAAR